MKLTVAGRNIEITDGIRDHLQNKIHKTIYEMGEETDVHVALSVEKHRHFAEVTLKTKGFSLHSTEETDDLYASIDNALVKIEKQLRKHKKKAQALRNKKGLQLKDNT
jgi:putative sigma-54 modulation protein